MPGVIYQLDCAQFAAHGETPAEVLEFIKAHDLDPAVVPAEVQLIVREHEDGLHLHARRALLDGAGNNQACPYCPGCVATEAVDVPLRAMPPALDQAFVARPIADDELAST